MQISCGFDGLIAFFKHQFSRLWIIVITYILWVCIGKLGPITPAATPVTEHLHWHLQPGYVCNSSHLSYFQTHSGLQPHPWTLIPVSQQWKGPLTRPESPQPQNKANGPPESQPCGYPVTFPTQTLSGALPGHWLLPRPLSFGTIFLEQYSVSYQNVYKYFMYKMYLRCLGGGIV